MNNVKQLKEQQKDVHPGFSSYLDCMSRALGTGVAAFTLAFSSTYIAQTLLKNNLPYNKNGFIIFSSLVSCGISYYVTRQRTQVCQAAWMAAEDKHTYFTQKD